MDISGLIKAVLAPLEGQQPGGFLQTIQPGDQLIGRILKIESDGRALVDLGGSKVLAQIQFAVKPGQTLPLQVVETGPVLHLRVAIPSADHRPTPLPQTDFLQVLPAGRQTQLLLVADSLTAVTASLRHPAAIPGEVQNAAALLKTLFEPVPVEQPADQIAQWIKSALEDRGALFEKHLADWFVDAAGMTGTDQTTQGRGPRPTAIIQRDMKAQLLILNDFLDHIDDPQATALKLDHALISSAQESLERLLGHVGQLQERAVARWQTGATQQIMVHWLPQPTQPAPLQLKVYYPRKGTGETAADRHHIAMLLDMDRLGPVRVDLAMIGRNLHIGFFVGSQEIKTCFAQAVEQIEQSLGPKFDRLQVEIFVSQEKIGQFHQEDLKGGAGCIDINA
jgi:hypothetical protein